MSRRLISVIPLLMTVAFVMQPVEASERELKLPPMHHLVHVVPSDAMQISDQILLNKKGEIDCVSCHGIKDIADIPLDEVDRAAPDFFIDAPYPTMGAFCARCHDSKKSERSNIHILIDSRGKLIEDRCLFCHLEVPDNQVDMTDGQPNNSAKLRLPAQKLCLGCHLKTPHLNAINHLTEIPTEASGSTLGDMAAQLKRESEKQGYHLPLIEGEIGCITCHTSHQREVIKPQKNIHKAREDRTLEDGVGYADHAWNKVAAADRLARIEALAARSKNPVIAPELLKKQLQYRRLTHEVLIRASAKDGTLCLLCHQFDK